MDVDIRDLELLDALGEHATLTAAARHLYVSQPALSQRLLRLEERLATPLFERRGRRLVANAAGRRMLHAAQVTLRELRAARLDLHELADGRRRPLRLASQCATNYQWMADVVRIVAPTAPRHRAARRAVARRRPDRRPARRPPRRRPRHQTRRRRQPRAAGAAVRRRATRRRELEPPVGRPGERGRRRLRRGASRALRQLRPSEDPRRAVADPGRRPPGTPHHGRASAPTC